MKSKMMENDDRREWNLEGQEVTYLHIDFRFAFECWWPRDNLLTVIIESPFEFRHLGRTVVCKPEDVNSLTEVISILHKPLSAFTAFRDGRLLVTFSDGAEIFVAKDPQYESWEAEGKGELADLSLLCTPHEGSPWGE